MAEGHIYCFTNPYMPGMVKIGMTERTPEERLSEANKSDTWRLPDWKIEFAKKVNQPLQKEKKIHALLEKLGERVPGREFFKVPLEDVRDFFEIADGEWWTGSLERAEVASPEPVSSSKAAAPKKGAYPLEKYFKNDQRIRHTLDKDKILIGTYDSSKNAIICDGGAYTSLSGFVKAHYEMEGKKSNRYSGWKCCECEVNGSWTPTQTLIT